MRFREYSEAEWEKAMNSYYWWRGENPLEDYEDLDSVPALENHSPKEARLDSKATQLLCHRREGKKDSTATRSKKKLPVEHTLFCEGIPQRTRWKKCFLCNSKEKPKTISTSTYYSLHSYHAPGSQTRNAQNGETQNVSRRSSKKTYMPSHVAASFTTGFGTWGQYEQWSDRRNRKTKEAAWLSHRYSTGG